MQFSRRRLPHIHVIGQPLFVTFRLHGSLPRGREFCGESMSSGKAFVCMDRLLDNCCAGPTYLRIPSIAALVRDSIEQGGKGDYALHAWVIMPNHIHLLITPQADVSKLMQKLKGTTARYANQQLGRTGMPFWQDESYDHWVRGADEARRIESYVVQNPVRAGLVALPEEYAWSSAARVAEACCSCHFSKISM